MRIEEVFALRARREAGEDLPYTREEAQALIAHVRKMVRDKAGSRAKRSAANKAEWAARKQSRA